jgi:hypothetical protein
MEREGEALTQVKHTALTTPEANRQERHLAAMRSPIQVTHAVALTKRVTVHEKYANDMEDVASIFGQTAYALRHVACNGLNRLHICG